ncbi:MAG: DUF5110 domain-containing protein [Spartobacteria bacterium]|nr:DUF5110 domain-containing protein [Spartobacteria bacterium]
MKKMKTPVVFGNARFTVYSEGCVRMEFSRDGQFSPYPSLLVGKQMARGIKADVSADKKALTIRTTRFELTYQDNGEVFSAENLKVVHRNHVGGREVWTPGKEDKGNLGLVRRCLDQWQWCGGPDHQSVPGILSTEGGHFLADDARVYWNTKYDWPECLAGNVPFDGYFFAYGSDYKQALQDFVHVFGRIPMIPRWAFGFWYSRWYAYNHQEVIDLVKRYRKEGIPMDVMVIDTDWRDGWGGYDWSAKYFPAPEKTLAQLHALGVHTGLNDHPGYDNYDALPEKDSHIPAIEKRLGSLPHQGQWACDWSNKAAVAAWKDILLGPFFDQGMDFWWIDGWLKPPFGGMKSQLWANQQYFELCEERTGRRGLILSRWGGVGSHRYPVQFSGDTASEWGVLKHQVEYTSRSGNLGAVYWSHDIGGFFAKEVDEELFIRWAQFGAMSPIFRTHSDHGNREPWKYSPQAKRLFKKQTRIRYALVPYFYTMAWQAHTCGLPIIRPLYLEYSENDGGAMWRKHQYTIGKDMLVIPADEPINKQTGVLRKRVYFPKGRWFGLETDEIIQGTEDRWIDIPIERIPTYIHEGAIIPSQPVRESIGTKVTERVEFDYYPDLFNPSSFDLYEDDGETKAYENRECAMTTVTGKRTTESIEMAVSAPKGAYQGQPGKRIYVLRVRLEEAEQVDRLEGKVGNGAWKKIRAKTTSTCLAGAVKSGHRFCEATVESANQAVAIRMFVK